MKTTRYFEEQVLRKRSYLRREWCERIIANPLKKEVQPDGRIRHWGKVADLGGRVLRVVTLEDGRPFTTLSRIGILGYHEARGGDWMKLHYYPETDSLYIDLRSIPSADSREVAEGLVIDFDAEGNVVGIDIDHASQKLDLQTLETVSLPALSAKLS